MTPHDESTLLLQNAKPLNHLAFTFRGTGLPVEDLQQEVRIAALRAIRAWSPDGGASVSTLIFRSAINHLCHLRRAKRTNRRRARAVYSLDAPVAGTEVSWGERIGTAAPQVSDLQRAELGRLIARLPPLHQQVVAECLLDRDVRSIGKDLGISKSRVDQVYRDAVNRLSRMCRDRMHTGRGGR